MALLTEEVQKKIKLYDFDSVSLPIFNKKFDDKISKKKDSLIGRRAINDSNDKTKNKLKNTDNLIM